MDNYAENLADWSRLVRERDKRCIDCGTNSGLVAHHIKPKSEYPEEKLALSNGQTLCANCHLEHHRKHPVSNKGARQRGGIVGVRTELRRVKAEIVGLRAENLRLNNICKELERLRGQCDEYEKAYNSLMSWK